MLENHCGLVCFVVKATLVALFFVVYIFSTGSSLDFSRGRVQLQGNSSAAAYESRDGAKHSSYSRSGPKGLWPSVSNFVLLISLNNNSQSSIGYLFFLDSGGGSYPEVISKAQVEWFGSKSQEINPDSSVPGLIFWHIPSKAYAAVAPWWAIWNPCVGSINKEKVTPQESEEGMMELLEKRPSVKAIFVGHDHGLDWRCPYKKLWLCYARHTGNGGYGNWARGARIIEINQEPFGIKSWIRMENGDVHSEVVLNG